MKCALVVEDWRQRKCLGSIYQTELGTELAAGDLHSGSTFLSDIKLAPEIEEELKNAWEKHGAYVVFQIIPEKKTEK